MRITARPWQMRCTLSLIGALFLCPRGLDTHSTIHDEVSSRLPSSSVANFRGRNHLSLRGGGQNPAVLAGDSQSAGKKSSGQNQETASIQTKLNELADRVGDPQWADVIRLLPFLARKDVRLPNAVDGTVVTRFRQQTSSPLHIGQAHEILLNDFFAKIHRGKMMVTLDDVSLPQMNRTDESILEDLELFCLSRAEIKRTSEFDNHFLRVCTQVIARGEAYIDEDPLATASQRGSDSERTLSARGRSVQENIERWEEMQAETKHKKTYCIRARLNISSSEDCLRDPVIFRCQRSEDIASGHHLFPTSEFAAPVVDSLQGVTHILSSPEHRTRDEEYVALCKLAGFQPPEIVVMPGLRLELAFTVRSSSAVTWFVDKTADWGGFQGFVDGFSDSRLPTMRGMQRRGLSLKALQAFALSHSVATQTALAEDHRLWALNTRLLQPSAPTFVAVAKQGCCTLIVGNFDDFLAKGGQARVQVPRNESDASAGSKVVLRGPRLLLEDWDAESIADSDKITLKDWGNVRIVQITERDVEDEEQEQEQEQEKEQEQEQEVGAQGGERAGAGDGSGGSRVLRGDWLPDDNNFRTSKTFSWLPGGAQLAELTPLELQYDGPLLKCPRADESDEKALENAFNANSQTVIQAWGDPNMRSLTRGAVVHLDRKGLFIVDSAYSPAKDGLSEASARLICIPSGQAVRRYARS